MYTEKGQPCSPFPRQSVTALLNAWANSFLVIWWRNKSLWLWCPRIPLRVATFHVLQAGVSCFFPTFCFFIYLEFLHVLLLLLCSLALVWCFIIYSLPTVCGIWWFAISEFSNIVISHCISDAVRICSIIYASFTSSGVVSWGSFRRSRALRRHCCHKRFLGRIKNSLAWNFEVLMWPNAIW